jgi:hypothetical protein
MAIDNFEGIWIFQAISLICCNFHADIDIGHIATYVKSKVDNDVYVIRIIANSHFSLNVGAK